MSHIFFDRELDTVATYWRIYRRDGVALGFTTHDRDLYFGGLLHRAAPGMVPSAIKRTIDLTDDEAEINGALSHDAIRSVDILSGRFDNARIETGVVNWESFETATLYTGSIDTVSRDNAGFSAQLRSAKADLDAAPVPRSSPSCRADFCGPGCALSAASYETRSALSAIDLIANRLTFDIPDPQDYTHGHVRWLDGPQTGQISRIIAVRDGAFVVDRPIDPGQAKGDRAIVRQGCGRTIAICSGRFDNAINFQGEPFLPGNDAITQYPQAR